jgi:hypothetical protein
MSELLGRIVRLLDGCHVNISAANDMGVLGQEEGGVRSGWVEEHKVVEGIGSSSDGCRC